MQAELRLKIWHESWKPRVVDTLRVHLKNHSLYFDGMSYEDLKLGETWDADDEYTDDDQDSGSNSGSNYCESERSDIASIDPSSFPDGVNQEMHDNLARLHAHAMLLEWGEDAITRPSTEMHPSSAPPPHNKEIFYTVTHTTAVTPISMFINQESRIETLKHYKLAWGLPRGETRVFFNFNLDILAFDIDGGPVLFKYQQADLVRLQRAMIWATVTDPECPITEFGNSSIRTRYNKSKPEAYAIPESRAGSPRSPWKETDRLRADHSIAGAKRRFPSLHEIFIRTDAPWADCLPLTEMDMASPMFQREDFRYVCSPDSGASDLRRWEPHHFMFRLEAGTITSHRNIISQVKKYTLAIPHLPANRATEWFYMTLPRTWETSTVDFSGHFLCKIAISTVPAQLDVNYNEIVDCDVKWAGQDKLEDLGKKGHAGRVLSRTCLQTQLWNEMSDWVSMYMGQEILVDDRHTFQLELKDPQETLDAWHGGEDY